MKNIEVILTLWGDGGGNWILSIDYDMKEVSLRVGAGQVRDLTEDRQMKFADKIHKDAVSLKEAATKAKVAVWKDSAKHYLNIILPGKIPYLMHILDNEAFKLLDAGIPFVKQDS